MSGHPDDGADAKGGEHQAITAGVHLPVLCGRDGQQCPQR